MFFVGLDFFEVVIVREVFDMKRCNIVRMRAFKVISHIYSFRQKNNAIFQHYLNKYRMSLSTLPTTHIEIINPPKRVVFFTNTKNNLPTQGSQGSMPKKQPWKLEGASTWAYGQQNVRQKIAHPSRGPGKMKQFVSMDHWVFWTSRESFLSSPTNRLVSLDFVKFQTSPTNQQKKKSSPPHVLFLYPKNHG